MSNLVSTFMADIIAHANEMIQERVDSFIAYIQYGLSVLRTEVAWMKSRGENYTELNATDVMNNIRIDRMISDTGTLSLSVYINEDYQKSIESDQMNILWQILSNARKLTMGGGLSDG